MAHTDLPYLRHMLDAVEKVQRYLDGVDPEFRWTIPQIPWSKVIGMRSRLIHGYLSVDPDIVWHTATHHLPRLRTDLVTAIRGLEK